MNLAISSFTDHLKQQGLTFTVASDLARDDDHDGELISQGERPIVHHGFGTGPILEVDHPLGSLGSDHATQAVAKILQKRKSRYVGKKVLELGCGTGVLAIQAAMNGALVIATDLDPEAVRLSRENAVGNGVKVDVRFGSLFDPIQDNETFELIIANLPHKPAPLHHEKLPMGQHGGSEGDTVLSKALPGFLRAQPSKGELLFFQHSLPNPRWLRRVSEDYDLEIQSWKLRWLQDGEYGELIENFRQRHDQGTSFLWSENGRDALIACVWSAIRKSTKP